MDRDEVEKWLNENIEREVKRDGANGYYANAARKWAAKKLAEFDAGNAVCVGRSHSYIDAGMEWEDEYMSDGTVKHVCYGYWD